jgi:hypothetical protein
MYQYIEKHSTLVLFTLVSLVAVLYLANLRGGQDWGDDFALYILHAQNLVQGKAYAETGYLYNPEQPDYSPKAYPPVFPILLAPFVAVFGQQLTALKFVGVAAFLAFLFLFTLILSKTNLPVPARVVLTLSLALHPLFWMMTDRILSDLPFLLIVTLALLQIEALFVPKKNGGSKIVLSGLLIYLAYGTRTVGAMLLFVLFAYDFYRNRRISISSLKAAGIAITLGVIQALVIQGTGSYIDTIADAWRGLGEQVITFSRFYYDSFSHLFPFRDEMARHLTFDIALVLALVGYALRWKKGASVFEIFTPTYLAVVLLWPAYQGMRFLIPILPLFLLYGYEGGVYLFRALDTPRPFQLAGLGVLILVLGISYLDGRKIPAFQRSDRISQPETQQMFSYMRNQVPQNAVVAFYKPRALSLFTGHPSMLVAGPPRKTSAMDQFNTFQAKYFIVETDNPISEQLEWGQFVLENADTFELVYQNPKFNVFIIH